MGFRQIFGGCRPPKYFTDGVRSNIWGVYDPKIFDGCGSVKYLGGLHPQNSSRMGFRQIFGVYSPKIFDGWRSVKYLGGLHRQNISRVWFRQIFGGSTPPKYLTDGVASNIWGVYDPKIFDGCGSVKYLGGLHPQSVHGWGSVKYLGSTAPKYLTDGVPSNIWGVYTAKIFDGCGSVKHLGGLHPQNI